MVNLRIDELLRRSTVRIVSKGGYGSGFLVAPDLVVTCAHVLFDRNRQSIGELIQWDQDDWDHDPIPINYDRVAKAPDDDVAIFRIVPVGLQPIRLSSDLELDDPLYSFGYTDEFPDGDSLTARYEGPSHGKRSLMKLKSGQVRPGMSGAPILNFRTGFVCGMVVQTRDRRSDLGGRGISTSMMLTAFPGIVASRAPSVPSHPALRDIEVDLRAQINVRLALMRDELLARAVSGSQRLRVADVFREPGLLVPFRSRFSSKSVDGSADLLETIPNIPCNESSSKDLTTARRWLVLAPPGAGKSTFARAAAIRLTGKAIANPMAPIPVLLDLRDYREDATHPDFGTRGWLLERLGELTRPGSVAWKGISEDIPGLVLEPFIILDSLDEFMAGQPLPEAHRILNCFLLRCAQVVCCRTQHYERYLAMSSFADMHEVVQLAPFDDDALNSYPEAYYKLCFPEQHEELVERFKGRLRASGELTAICRLPLRLNMALDLLSPQYDGIPLVADLLGLYQAYVRLLLSAESDKADSSLAADEKVSLLEALAWYFYDEGSRGESAAPPFTDSEFRNFLASRYEDANHAELKRIAEDFRTRSLLNVDAKAYAFLEPGTLNFAHKSFQEYLVASYVFHAMTEDAERTSMVFRNYMSPEVSEFLKEYIARVNVSKRLLAKFATIATEALRMNAGDNTDLPTIENARRRLARGQLGYYLGHLRDESVVEFLREQLMQEADPWLRRNIVIGLSFGGEERYLHAYIAKLHEERTGPGPYVENDVNVGFHLSFFGDQPFDPIQPDRDQRLPHCSRTVARLVYQLGTETDFGSWRLNLFTLVDLWEHRQISRESCRQALVEQVPRLRAILASLENDDRAAWWPERQALGEILAKLETDGTEKGAI
jgi:hypothetical protein